MSLALALQLLVFRGRHCCELAAAHRHPRTAVSGLVMKHRTAVADVALGNDITSPAVVFDHVTFAFDEHVVLSDVSFTIPRGSMTILLGASGRKSVLSSSFSACSDPTPAALS